MNKNIDDVLNEGLELFCLKYRNLSGDMSKRDIIREVIKDPSISIVDDEWNDIVLTNTPVGSIIECIKGNEYFYEGCKYRISGVRLYSDILYIVKDENGFCQYVNSDLKADGAEFEARDYTPIPPHRRLMCIKEGDGFRVGRLYEFEDIGTFENVHTATNTPGDILAIIPSLNGSLEVREGTAQFDLI